MSVKHGAARAPAPRGVAGLGQLHRRGGGVRPRGAARRAELAAELLSAPGAGLGHVGLRLGRCNVQAVEGRGPRAEGKSAENEDAREEPGQECAEAHYQIINITSF